MTEKDSGIQKREEPLESHILTPAEFQKLIAEKMERAKFYSFSYRERERRAELVD